MILPALLLPIQPREGGNSMLIFGVQLLAMFAIFYFLLIRPQSVEAKKLREMLDALKKGDEIVTSGGIIGTVLHVEADRVTIKSAENTRLIVERARIARVLTAKSDKAEAKAEARSDAKSD